MSEFHISKIVIIDSLEESEFQTGVEIEKVIRHEISTHNLDLPVRRYSVSWSGEFKMLIELLAKEPNEIPLLHVEMHGDPIEGLIFANNSTLNWNEVNQALAPLNKVTRFNLVCVFSACYGAYFTEALYVNYASPCFALIAPEDELHPGELHYSFRKFYHNLAATRDLGVASALLKTEKTIQSEWFSARMDHWFSQVIEAYVRQEASVEAIHRRAKIVRLAALDLSPNVATLADMEMALLLKSHQYVKYIAFNRFFMTAEIPENIYRFSSINLHIIENIIPLLANTLLSISQESLFKTINREF
jgi:hypothetical protein